LPFRHLSSLTSLELSEFLVSLWGLKNLKHLPNLKTLKLCALKSDRWEPSYLKDKKIRKEIEKVFPEINLELQED